MSNRIDNVLIHPLFTEVLSGEFFPPSDPEGRAHRLSRLAIRAVEAGQIDEAAHRTFTYKPSWANSVEAIVATDYLFDPNIYIMSRLSLKAASGGELDVLHLTANGLSFVNIDYAQSNQRLELGRPLIEAQVQITQLAQQLFDASEA